MDPCGRLSRRFPSQPGPFDVRHPPLKYLDHPDCGIRHIQLCDKLRATGNGDGFCHVFLSELVSARKHYVVFIHPIFNVDNFAQHTDSKNYPIYVFWGVRGDKDK